MSTLCKLDNYEDVTIPPVVLVVCGLGLLYYTLVNRSEGGSGKFGLPSHYVESAEEIGSFMINIIIQLSKLLLKLSLLNVYYH